MTTEDTPIPGPLNNVIKIDDERIRGITYVIRFTLVGLLMIWQHRRILMDISMGRAHGLLVWSAGAASEH